ncbi:Quinone oxidoreductase-like protein 2 [Sphaceloma murrayae]|uniref:Quinone oxidoreductase-like protein 2 n=1 Tax=Sphaceloma murrayae TaxID=2082308 RepID=A0A2K1QHE3_9PEZI|nr:Quinone oxidoreductase-like protein 2 [Sphaceloma murrayae]
MEAIHLTSFLPASEPFTSLRPTALPIPTPKPDETLIRVTHVSIQQVDLLYARGLHQNNHPKRGHVHPPFTLGLDFAGIVLSTPSSRSSAPPSPSTTPDPSFPPGTRVLGSHPSSFATHLCLPASSLHPIPPSLSSRDAAALVSGVVSHTAVRLAAVSPRQTVLVTGVPGTLGLTAAQSALSTGATVFVLARDPLRANAVRGVLDARISVLSSQGEDWKKTLEVATGGRGVDVVIDNVGLVQDALSVLRFGGTVVLVGFAGRGGEMERVQMNRVLLKGAKVVGYRFGEGARRGMFDVGECWRGYLGEVERGEVKAVVDGRRYRGLGEVGRAMEDLQRGALVGKAVVEVGGEEIARL